MKTIRVTEKHIRESEAGQCFRCAVARALQEKTGDSEAKVYSDDWILRLQVWSQSIVAPFVVMSFVQEFDSLPRTPTGKAVLPDRLEGRLAPFSFQIPSPRSRTWDDKCYGCEHYFKTKELDDEGYCKECQLEQAAV